MSLVKARTYGGEMLICGGGGSGGCGQDASHYGGGAGAGQCIHMLDFIFTVGEVYTITVGAGVSWTNNQNSAGTPGNSSSVEVGNAGKVYTTSGGGRGSGYYDYNAGTPGGGGSYPGDGSAGAAGVFSDPSIYRISPQAGSDYGTGGSAAGGGGATGAGGATGVGGSGYTSTITGSSYVYSVGGYGPTNGVTNTTYGSGGNGGRNANPGSAGIQGVVIMRVPTVNYSGTTTGSPTVATDGIYTILTFTGNGSYTG